jgi:hypothetical protein
MKNTMKLMLLASALLVVACSSTLNVSYSNTGTACPSIPEEFRWKTIADAPQWGSALVASLLGVKDISRYVTGGLPFTSTVYDWNGAGLNETKNQNDEMISVVDIGTGCEIGTKEYADRKVFFKNRADAPGYQSRQLINGMKFN